VIGLIVIGVPLTHVNKSGLQRVLPVTDAKYGVYVKPFATTYLITG